MRQKSQRSTRCWTLTKPRSQHTSGASASSSSWGGDKHAVTDVQDRAGGGGGAANANVSGYRHGDEVKHAHAARGRMEGWRGDKLLPEPPAGGPPEQDLQPAASPDMQQELDCPVGTNKAEPRTKIQERRSGR